MGRPRHANLERLLVLGDLAAASGDDERLVDAGVAEEVGGDVAKALRIKGPSATHIVRRLSENGLILALPIEGDGRRKQLVPMDRHLDPDLSDPLNRAIRTLAAGLDERDARTVTKFLAALAELVDAECR